MPTQGKEKVQLIGSAEMLLSGADEHKSNLFVSDYSQEKNEAVLFK